MDMNETDLHLKQLAQQEDATLPPESAVLLKDTLDALPKHPKHRRSRRIATWVASSATLLLCLFFLLPNLSPTVAAAMASVPALRSIIEVITIRKESYRDDYHQLEVETPSLSGDGDASLDSAMDTINGDIRSLTDRLTDRFRSDMDGIGDQAHTAMSVTYDVITNSETWFTLRITVWEGAGSSNTYYKFYHIDKTTGDIVTLSKLLSGDYVGAISTEIRRQMQERMAEDDAQVYWLGSDAPLSEFSRIADDQNFYFNAFGELVIVFDKYEVAPGALGCPEFTVPAAVWQPYRR